MDYVLSEDSSSFWPNDSIFDGISSQSDRNDQLIFDPMMNKMICVPPPELPVTTKGKRQHCKVNLFAIVMDGLKNPENTSAIKWLKKDETFQINWEKFVIFYNTRGKSTAKETNIKNRFTRKKTGFKRETQIPEPGYDTVFSHSTWKDETPPSKKPRKAEKPSSPPVPSTPPTSFYLTDQSIMQQIQQIPLQQMQQIPVQQIPVQQMQQMQQMPVQQMQQMPVQQIPVQQMQQMPVQQMPVQQMPVQQLPVQQMPVQQPPVQQPPVQQIPVQQIPVQQIQQMKNVLTNFLKFCTPTEQAQFSTIEPVLLQQLLPLLVQQQQVQPQQFQQQQVQQQQVQPQQFQQQQFQQQQFHQQQFQQQQFQQQQFQQQQFQQQQFQQQQFQQQQVQQQQVQPQQVQQQQVQQQQVQQQQVQPQQVQPQQVQQEQMVQPTQQPQQVQQEQMVQPTQQPQQDEMILRNLIKDDDAVNFLLKPFNMIEDESFKIKPFLKRMCEKDYPMTLSDFNNLAILMASESSSQQNESITLEQFKNFLLRFGPLTKSLDKMRDFVNAGASRWFHGNVDREKAVEILKTSLNKEKCIHYLIRSVPMPNGTFEPNNYVFAVSYICPNEDVRHCRTYTDALGRFCHAVHDGHVPKYNIVKDFKSYLERTLKLEPDTSKPVSCTDFAELHNQVFLSEQDVKNGYC